MPRAPRRASVAPSRARRRAARKAGARKMCHPLFVIQKHAASHVHYDLRLEVGGVLKSWAVPKGPSLDPRDKRLAVAVEDHKLDYADFEGVIEEGEYGAGAAIVWDAGRYRNLARDAAGRELPMDKALARGRVQVRLEGRKIRGGHALVRTRLGDGRSWLLIKMKDEGADARRRPTRTEPRSVLSGRTVEEVAAEEASRAAARGCAP